MHILGNEAALRKFREEPLVPGRELPLTDFDPDAMSVQSVLDFMAAARKDGERAHALTLRAREGASLHLLRLFGAWACYCPCLRL